MTWFLLTPPRARPRVRLVCLPPAGSGAAAFRAWPGLLPADVEVLPVQLPGRGWRVREAAVSDLRRLAEMLAGELGTREELPTAIFGHSMGSWLGLELARHLEAEGRGPIRLFASSRQAPSLGCTQGRISHLDDDRFLAAMKARYQAVPPEIENDREMLALLLPGLRADMAALESHVHRPAAVRCPITAFLGESDHAVPVEQMAPWAAETTGSFRVTTFRGGHFYFAADPKPVIAAIATELAEASSARTDGVSAR
jgi:medium-chain acyl-[acyl-carrier-protein] hydrolase